MAATGLPVPSGFSYAGFAAWAVEEWERRTGYQPFLAGGSATRSFDPPGANRRNAYGFSLLGGGRILDLKAGLVSLSSLMIGVGSGEPGTALVSGTDFWLEPLNADLQSQPWTRVRFRAPVFGPEASITVSGVFGYGASVPEDAWQAIVRLGAAATVDLVVEGLLGGTITWAEETVKEALSPSALVEVGQRLRRSAEATLCRYRRVSL